MSTVPGDGKIDATQKQVDQVVDIMRDNMEKVLDRDTKLSDLDSRADALQMESAQFVNKCTPIKKKNVVAKC